MDFFHILDYSIVAVPGLVNDYRLRKLDDVGHLLACPPVEQSSPGNIVAGNYLIGRFP